MKGISQQDMMCLIFLYLPWHYNHGHYIRPHTNITTDIISRPSKPKVSHIPTKLPETCPTIFMDMRFPGDVHTALVTRAGDTSTCVTNIYITSEVSDTVLLNWSTGLGPFRKDAHIGPYNKTWPEDFPESS